MNIVCCQFDVAWEDKPKNFARARAMLQATPPTPGSLVLLPEMFATGFSMNVAAVAESVGGPTETFLAQLAQELKSFVIGGLAVSDGPGRATNQAVGFDPGGREVVRYSKMQPFAPGGEAVHYAAGGAPRFFDWSGVTVCPFICYDLRFPELFRRAAWRRPQVYTVIASWPEARIGHWVKLLQARAIENQAYVAGTNRTGRDPQFNHVGRSVIVNPHGEILADAGTGSSVISVELDLVALEEYRRKLPFLGDMKVEHIGRPT